MKLLLYGGGCEADNTAIDKAVFEQLRLKKPTITYVPSSSFDHEDEFKAFARHFRKLKTYKTLCFPIDTPTDKVMQKYAFKSDIIHLSGGNTYYFLHHLRKNGYLKKLKHFASKGGLLTGLSAGAILMTPTIHTAGFPKFDRDDNCVRIKNLKGLHLVDFEFFPHYVNSHRYDKALLSHSKKSKHVIYACPDGGGIFVNGASKTFFGQVYAFYRGQKIVL